MKMRTLTPEEQQQIADALNAGDFPRDVAAKFDLPLGRAFYGLQMVLCRPGSPNYIMPWYTGNNFRIRQGLNRLHAGEDPQFIADYLGVTLRQVLNWQKKYPKP